MSRYQTKGIVLKRVDYGEADRIITFLTEDHGKISAIAKGVRKPKSKLAGGIELLSVCELGLIKGKGDVQTVVSTRLAKHYDAIVADYERLETAYSMLRLIDKLTTDEAGNEYFNLLSEGLLLLANETLHVDVVACWFVMQIMQLNGSAPNLLVDVHGKKLQESATYGFSTEDGGFFPSDIGTFNAIDIKAWRVFMNADQKRLLSVTGLEASAEKSSKILLSFAEFQI